MINEGESNKKLLRILTGKNLRMTDKKISRADLIKKRPEAVCLNRCVLRDEKRIPSYSLFQKKIKSKLSEIENETAYFY